MFPTLVFFHTQEAMLGPSSRRVAHAPLRRLARAIAVPTRKVALIGCVGWCSEVHDRDMHVKLLRDKLGDPRTVVEAAVLGDQGIGAVVEGASAIVALEFNAAALLSTSDATQPVLLQSPGSGTERIHLGALERFPGITVCNAGGHEAAMAEYLVLGMLAHAHDFIAATSSFRDGSWRMSAHQGPGA